MTQAPTEKAEMTDSLSESFQGPCLCPVCEEGYLVALKGKNCISGVDVDIYFELCINGCGSEQASSICVNENARIAREAGFKKYHWVEDS